MSIMMMYCDAEDPQRESITAKAEKMNHILSQVASYDELVRKLRTYYKESLERAYSTGDTSVMIPLIIPGNLYNRYKAGRQIAIDETRAFFSDHDPECKEIKLIIPYNEIPRLDLQIRLELENYRIRDKSEEKEHSDSSKYIVHETSERYASRRMDPDLMGFLTIRDEVDLRERVEGISQNSSFCEYLSDMIRQKGYTPPTVYNAGLLTRQTFSKIINGQRKPTGESVMQLCMGLRLNLQESKKLLSKAGYALRDNNKTDVIFAYFIEKENYDIDELNEALFHYGERTFGIPIETNE